ncbi:MAG: class I SAM-dependent methyltransferase [Salinibacter sp.]
MKYQDERHEKISEKEMVELERGIFNENYDEEAILGREGLEFSLEEFWEVNSKPYKRGAHKRGYRKRRLFEMMDVENIDGKRILDVGCGRGVESVVCAKYGASVAGVDISGEAIKIAKMVSDANNVSDRCDFSVQNVQNMEFKDRKFDIVFCNAVLHHILKYEGVIQEMVRVLKEDEKFVFGGSLRRNPVYNKMRNLKRYIRGKRVDGDVDLKMSDIEDISKYFEKSEYEFYESIRECPVRKRGDESCGLTGLDDRSILAKKEIQKKLRPEGRSSLLIFGFIEEYISRVIHVLFAQKNGNLYTG